MDIITFAVCRSLNERCHKQNKKPTHKLSMKIKNKQSNLIEECWEVNVVFSQHRLRRLLSSWVHIDNLGNILMYCAFFFYWIPNLESPAVENYPRFSFCVSFVFVLGFMHLTRFSLCIPLMNWFSAVKRLIRLGCDNLMGCHVWLCACVQERPKFNFNKNVYYCFHWFSITRLL